MNKNTQLKKKMLLEGLVKSLGVQLFFKKRY